MRIAVGQEGVELLDQNTFTAFDVLAPDLDAKQVLEGLGERAGPSDEPDHVFISISAVRSLAGPVDQAWEQDFQAMLDYAGSKGWLNAAGDHIKAHISQS